MLVDMNMESTVKQPVAKRAYEGDNGANVRQNLEQLLKVLKFSTQKENLAQVLKEGRYFKSKATQKSEQTALRRRAKKAAKRMANKKGVKRI